jgi:hypothetical protein
MFPFIIPEPKDAQGAQRQAIRHERAKQVIRDGYTFSYDAGLNCIYVCKPGCLHADYIIHGDTNNLTGQAGCDCPDMVKTGEPCKHYLAAWIDAKRHTEDADAAQVEAYETARANAGVHESLLPNDYPF